MEMARVAASPSCSQPANPSCGANLFDPCNVEEGKMLNSLGNLIVTTDSDNIARTQDYDLIGVTNIVCRPVGQMNPKGSERGAARQFQQVFGSHGTADYSCGDDSALAGRCKTPDSGVRPRISNLKLPLSLRRSSPNALKAKLLKISGTRFFADRVLQRPARVFSIHSYRFECRRSKFGEEGEAGDPAAGRRCRTTKPRAAAASSARYEWMETALTVIALE